MSFLNGIANAFNKHKLVRRMALVWSCWLITVVVLRVTEPEIITEIGTAGSSIVLGVIGILATVIGLYQTSRNKEECSQREGE